MTTSITLILALLLTTWLLMFFRKNLAYFLAKHPIIVKTMLIICIIFMTVLAIMPFVFFTY